MGLIIGYHKLNGLLDGMLMDVKNIVTDGRHFYLRDLIRIPHALLQRSFYIS